MSTEIDPIKILFFIFGSLKFGLKLELYSAAECSILLILYLLFSPLTKEYVSICTSNEVIFCSLADKVATFYRSCAT